VSTVLDSPVEPILREGSWEVKEMVLTWEKVEALWKVVNRYSALFSDLTKNDFTNFFGALTSKNTLWFEIWRDEQLEGVIWLTEIHMTVDASAHMMFLDSRPAEKKPVVRKLIQWVFQHYPLNRITVFVPESYHATKRLTEALGFAYEGKKRDAVLISGKWLDLVMYGLTRSMAERML
jgi:hypothetical protein